MNTQLYTSTSIHLGAALLVTTAVSTVFLPNAGIYPVLLILAAFLAVCFFVTPKIADSKHKLAIAVSGVLGSLLCHFSLTLLNNLY